MNRIKTPCCSKCKNAYQIKDMKNLRIPVLLNCGHDLCKTCLKYMCKSNEKVICEICQAFTIIEDKNQLYDIPLHYYLLGKLWCLNLFKNQELNASISNLDMTRIPSTSLKSNENNCSKCLKMTDDLCQDCNLLFCRICFEKMHLENQTYSLHKMITLDNTDSKLPQKLICNKHLRQFDCFCRTCRLKLCSVCANNDHQNEMFSDFVHEVVSFNAYNSYQLPHLSQITSNGKCLLQSLSSSRDTFYKNYLVYQDQLKKKSGDLNVYKQKVSAFISSITGSLQFAEQALVNSLNNAEQSVLDSMINVMNKLNGFVHGLQDKITTIDEFMKCPNENSCTLILDSIFAIEKMLETSLKVSKKNLLGPVVACNESIFDAVRQCIVLKIDNYSDTYILTDSYDIPQDYTCILSAQIDSNILHKRPNSCNSTESSNFSSSSMDHAVSKPLLEYSSVSEIKQNQIEVVRVTHVNSPSDFYLQLLENWSFLNKITTEMNGLLKTKVKKLNSIEMNNVIYAVLKADYKWFRGIIVNKNMDPNEMVYTVYCIDYGFTDSFTVDRIYEAPESIVSIPPLAFNCALYSLKPSLISGWSKTAIQDFNRFMLNEKGVYFMYPVNTHSEPLEVDVIWSNDIHPLSVRDAMFNLKHGSSDVPSNLEWHEKIMKIITLPKPEQLQKGASYKIHISHLISPFEFYLRINDETTILLKQMMDELQSKYQPTEMNRSYLLYSPQIGMAVAAKYSIDNDWYRAKITRLPDPRMVTVYYVDFGNSETLPWDQLRVLDHHLIQIPPLAIKACLADVQPAVDGIETTEWTSNAFNAFIQLIETSNNVDNLTACVQEIDDDNEDDDGNNIHKVILYNRWSRGEFCVNLQLIRQGFATSQDLESCVFQKPINRKPCNTIPIQLNSRNNETPLSTSEDFLAFTKQRSVIKSENHTWKPTKKKNMDTPGTKMKVHKVISPDDIILKYIDHNTVKLTKRMNEVYLADKKKFRNTVWKVKDLCAMFIRKYGNWYRGKVLEIDTNKKTASVYMYDLDEIHNEIPMKTLYNLDTSFVHIQCGFLHCSMSNLIPLGVSKSKWAKYSCDRLIEELMKYSFVYFLRQGKNDNKVLGEIWVEDIGTPQALEPVHKRWININKFMIEQGFALSDSQFEQDDDYSISSSESVLDKSFENSEYISSTNCWLPPVPLKLDKNCFNVIPLYVDMQCNIYFRIDNDETEQILQELKESLNIEFCNSSPEPVNFKWSLGQMVIVQYHLDKSWYRGTIIKVKENNEFEVQFLDYGNIETCSHENLRSTLYMTDIPQLCVKGFLSSIGPLTENKKWTIPELDFLHSYIVDKPCMVVIDFNLSTDTNYAITRIHQKSDSDPLLSDVCQYMVTSKKAYFLYMDEYQLNLNDFTPKIDNSLNINSNKNVHSTTITEINKDMDTGQTDLNEQNTAIIVTEHVDCNDEGNIGQSASNIGINNSSCKEQIVISECTNVDYLEDNDKPHRMTLVEEMIDNVNNGLINYSFDNKMNIVQSSTSLELSSRDAEKTICSVSSNSSDNLEEEDTKPKHNNKKSNLLIAKCIEQNHPDVSDLKENNIEVTSLNYSKVGLKFNDVIEASLCKVVGPTRMTLIIKKIGGIDLTIYKEEMNKMLMKCASMPKLDRIVPGTPVVVQHNFLWKRGIIVDGGESVHLIDCGVPIKLVKKNLRLCPEEFMDMPMFSIDCQLARVRKNKNVSAEDVVKKLTETLKSENLRVVGIDELDSDVVGVELFNNKKEIAYQSLIDSRMLVHK